MPHASLRSRTTRSQLLGLAGVLWWGVAAAAPVDSLPAGPNATDTSAGPRFTYVPADVTLSCAAAATYTHGLPRAVDGAGAPLTVSHVDAPLDGCGGSRTILRTFTARDPLGAEAIAVQSIHVVDDRPPRFASLPADTVLTFDDALPSPELVAVDDCGGVVEVAFRDDYHGSDEGPMLTRTYTAVDRCGNVATHEQSVRFVDDVASLAAVEPPPSAPEASAPEASTPLLASRSVGEPSLRGAVAAEAAPGAELDLGGATGTYIYVLSPFALELSQFIRLEPR